MPRDEKRPEKGRPPAPAQKKTTLYLPLLPRGFAVCLVLPQLRLCDLSGLSAGKFLGHVL